jgi:single-strand DNA-binding protein
VSGYSQVVLLGRLVRDPELRYTPQGKAVCAFCVAINRRHEKGEEVAFVDVTVWDRQAEVCAEYLRKGRSVLVSGRLAQDTWEDKETGKTRTKLRVAAREVTFLDGGGGPKGEESGAEVSSEAVPEETPAPHKAAPAVRPRR